jgi:hypothetical protein
MIVRLVRLSSSDFVVVTVSMSVSIVAHAPLWIRIKKLE